MAIASMFPEDQEPTFTNISSIPLDWGNIDPSQQFKILMKVKSLLFGGESSVSDYLADLASSDRGMFESELLRLVLIFHVGELVKINTIIKMGVDDMTKGLLGEGMFPPGESKSWNDDEINGYLGEMGFGDFIGIPDESPRNEASDIYVISKSEYDEYLYNRRLLGSLNLYGLEQWAWYEDAVADVEQDYPE